MNLTQKYYFVMDLDVNNKILTIPTVIKDELPEINRLVYSSTDFNDYNKCIEYAVKVLKEQGKKLIEEKQKHLDIYFEKNPLYDPSLIEKPLFEDLDPDYWLDTELVKCYLAELKDSSDDEDEVFMNTFITVRVFIKPPEEPEHKVLH